MFLTNAIERLKTKKIEYTTQSGTANRVFELHMMYCKNESGEVPIFIKPIENEKKKIRLH